jgi:hypothetical protein
MFAPTSRTSQLDTKVLPACWNNLTHVIAPDSRLKKQIEQAFAALSFDGVLSRIRFF